MRVLVGLMVLLLVLVGLALPGPASAKPAGDDAFLIDSVDSVEGLVKQVEDSRLLVLRYAKHFKVDPSNVITYFRNELSIEGVKETTALDVYHRKGLSEVESKSKEFKKGTKVFVNRNGIPILELGSGNPLADILPGKDVKQLPPKSTPKVTAANEQLPQQVGQQPTTAAQGTQAAQTAPTPGNPQLPNNVPGSTTSPIGDQVVSAVTTEPETAVLASGPLETITKAASKKGLFSALSGWVIPAGLVGAAALGAGGGSGGGGSVTGDGRNDPPTTVPEPAGLLALGTGAMALAGTIYRRTRAR